jgi:hypothetical protein
MLEPGRRSSGWIWLFGIAVLAIVVGTLYGINNQESQTASNEPAPAQVSGSNAASQSGAETTGSAPNNDQDKAGARNSGGSNKAAPANSPNAAAPQKDQSGQTNQRPQKQQ